MVKVSPGAKRVSSAIDWETHWARLSVPATGVPLVVSVAVGLGEALATVVDVAVGGVVAVRLGRGVAEGVRPRAWVTCANTVAATSVRKGSKLGVGVLVGAGEPQAANQSRLRNTPNMPRVFSVCAIWLFLYRCGHKLCPSEDFPELILRWLAGIVKGHPVMGHLNTETCQSIPKLPVDSLKISDKIDSDKCICRDKTVFLSAP
jgi:hypothetical protein